MTEKEIIESQKRSKTKFRLIFYRFLYSRNKHLFGLNAMCHVLCLLILLYIVMYSLIIILKLKRPITIKITIKHFLTNIHLFLLPNIDGRQGCLSVYVHWTVIYISYLYTIHFLFAIDQYAQYSFFAIQNLIELKILNMKLWKKVSFFFLASKFTVYQSTYFMAKRKKNQCKKSICCRCISK